MEELPIQIVINPDLYIKNPESSDLGKKIVNKGIVLIDECGFEAFNFKKLGKLIGSNESSIYRYFENKHYFLMYLVNWYWSWIEYKLIVALSSATTPKEKLHNAICILTEEVKEDHSFSYIDEVVLNRIIISESIKSFYTKDVDLENKKGFHKIYKRVVQRVSQLVLDVNPNFEFPVMLVSTVIESALQQRYFAEHIPGLTNTMQDKNDLVRFYKELVDKTLS
ncbi:TetR/AcrR family transcriptional regulator [Formosa sp. S-31]|uniref:TetR/AcrR family transcriptional regulator n=1 Tax=Formosa sp. S-31 TaxID=2790949 RepID=UPI003EB8E6B4